LHRFRRVTSSRKFIPEIDGLRFVAVTAVVLYHFCGFLPNGGDHVPFHAAIAHGYRGVNLFYAISGFVLGLPFALYHFTKAQRVSLRAYFIRRLTRLEPPYILNLFICFALAVVSENANPRALLPHLGASVLYLHNLVYGGQSAINPVAWTLEIEVQFYCLMPVFALFLSVRSRAARRTALSLSILLAGVIQVVFWDAPPRARMSILYAVQFFLTGLLLADLYVVDWRERPQSSWQWDVVSCTCWPIVFLMPDRLGWVFFPYLVLLLYVSAFRGVLFRKLFRNSLVTAIGGMCYTIYLFHYQLIPLVVKHGLAGNRIGVVGIVLFQVLFYLVALVTVSCAYFLLVERPCMKKDWPRQLASRAPRLFSKQAARGD
jgi:peptidoglycan/LPS O-acetylase OafA/YrhL